MTTTDKLEPVTIEDLANVTGGTHPADGGGPAEPTPTHGAGDAPGGWREALKPHNGKLIGALVGKDSKLPFGHP